MAMGDFVIAETAAKRLIAFEYETGERTTFGRNKPCPIASPPAQAMAA